MSQLATFINFQTHNYVIIGGILQQQLGVATEAYTRSITPLGTYQFDIGFGSEIPLLFNNRSIKITEKLITTMQNNCLQPMIDEGRVLSVLTKVPSITNNQVFIQSYIEDNNKNTYILPLSFMTMGGN